ncbi:LGFP repeat-containing protein [Blastococcus aurantiacus]|uniref:LGFP repeat-containing protein n=1 Tax=Blastococcus aurantiacus TaxID=1550231 RepID=A0A1G7L2C6_9ACTN|nr:serine hydrolase [Blastococcus aurantiacus]SDF43250.1 LGFP repeat-containing protein [Blastococcus aurantiacus]
MTKRWMRTFVAAAVAMALLLPGGGIARADSWQDRVSAGSKAATARGTTIEIAVLDRVTGQYRDNGRAAHTRIESASVMKVFIAEHLLHRRDLGQIHLSAADMGDMGRMLRESLDAPASRFWGRFGANAIVQEVIGRYGLTETRVTSNVRYWGNTLITAHDMVVFYRRMMDRSAGLSAASRDWIVGQLRRSTVQGDGARQFFGLRDGLPREQVIAQKQGWMCCVNGSIYRHSTGLIGPDGRFVVVVLTREPSSRGGAHIERSITDAVRTMFPEGLVPRVQGQIGEQWYRMGGASGRLGYPTSDEIRLHGGAVHFFQGGSIYWSPATGARAVWGEILKAYGALRWETGRLGYPTSSEIALPGGGAANSFQGGRIYWSPRTGAHSVSGSILAAYKAQRYQLGPLGFPTSDEIALPGGGTANRFQGGRIYWSSRTGAHWVIGSILAAYKAQHYQAGPLGFPTSDEIALPGGAVSHFQGGSVFWSPGRGAHVLRGGLLAAYKAQGYQKGSLGYPVSDAYRVTGGTRMDFQGGRLVVPTTPAPVPTAPKAAAVPGTSAVPAAPADDVGPSGVPTGPTPSGTPSVPAPPPAGAVPTTTPPVPGTGTGSAAGEGDTP